MRIDIVKIIDLVGINSIKFYCQQMELDTSLPGEAVGGKDANVLKHSLNTAIKCLKCDKVFIFPADKDDCLAHLYLEHRLVIADVDEIALLEDYLQYWEKEFQGNLALSHV